MQAGDGLVAKCDRIVTALSFIKTRKILPATIDRVDGVEKGQGHQESGSGGHHTTDIHHQT